MTEQISKERVNYMNAWIKTYDDGTQILQSYSTDVVKRTSSGKYIRLWTGWSISTAKQVYVGFGVNFKSLPFEDGTVEVPEVCRRGKRFDYWTKPHDTKLVIKDWLGEPTNGVAESVKAFVEALKAKDITQIVDKYSTCIDKELKQKYKKNKKLLELFRAMRVCLEEKPRKDDISMLCKMYDYNFKTVWSYLKPKYKFVGELR